DAIRIVLDLVAHHLQGLRQLGLELAIAEGCVMLQRSAQYADVGIPMDRHVVDATLAPVDLAQGAMECVVVHAVVGVKQCAIDVEQIGIAGAPVEGSRRRHLVYGLPAWKGTASASGQSRISLPAIPPGQGRPLPSPCRTTLSPRRRELLCLNREQF